jgi:hypothetical protein
MSDYNQYDLFNNPMVTAARDAMTPEMLENYKRLGESMYKDIDFENGTIQNIINETLQKLDCTLKSGLHPSMLSNDEKNLLKEEMGEKWYEKYGYVKEDLDKIVTIKIDK